MDRCQVLQLGSALPREQYHPLGPAGDRPVWIIVTSRQTCRDVVTLLPLFSLSLASFPTILSHALTGPDYYPFPLTHILSHDP